MKNDVIIKKILLRAKVIENKRKIDMFKKKFVFSTFFFCSLMYSLFKIIEENIPHHLQPQMSYASVINKYESVDIYVTIGILMFIFGSTIAIIILKNKK